MNRVEKVRKRLKKHRGRYHEIAKELNVSPTWVTQFANGRFVDPGANRIDSLEAWIEANG